MKTIIKIKTWSCPNCEYHQDFEPTPELMALHFPGVKAGHCPACYTGKNKTKTKDNVLMGKETNEDKKMIMTVMGEEDINPEIEEKDKEAVENGKSKMSKDEKDAYKLKRKEDIKEAIISAKLLEDKMV